MSFSWKKMVIKGLITAAFGAVTSLIALLRGVNTVDPYTASLVTIGIAVLTMAQNYLKNKGA